MLKPLAKLLKALSSNRDPGAIAHAFALGALLGSMPKDNLLWYLLFVFILFMRIQRGAFALSILFFTLLTKFTDPLFNQVGYAVLTQESLQPLFLKLIRTPFVAFTKFNNTIVMGSLVCAILAYIPLYLLSRAFVYVWRRYIGNFLRKLKILQMIKQVPLISKIIDAVEEA